MDVIIVCHTEFGFVAGRQIIFDKKGVDGVRGGVINAKDIAEKYGAKITFAVCPETAEFFPKGIHHEIGLHIHPGWEKFRWKNFEWYVGDAYLRKHCRQSLNSTVLRDYPFGEQKNMIQAGACLLEEHFGTRPKVFVAGRWSENGDTMRALTTLGFTHDCSAPPHLKTDHFDWSRIPRICLPYHPDENDYQKKGGVPLLIIPISRMLFRGIANPELAPLFGYPWLKASFLEYYNQQVPIFHICFHSPSMTSPYFMNTLDKYLQFLSHHQVRYRFASEITEYPVMNPSTNVVPYLKGINAQLFVSAIRKFL